MQHALFLMLMDQSDVAPLDSSPEFHLYKQPRGWVLPRLVDRALPVSSAK
jgi:hypothetical protein